MEQALEIFYNSITPSDYSNASMSQKGQLITLVEELGRSMCKGASEGEPAQVAQSQVVVIRSEKNVFETVDRNFTNVACDDCDMGVNTSAQVMLGLSIKEQYENWVCSEDGCNGACVVSAQVRRIICLPT